MSLLDSRKLPINLELLKVEQSDLVKLGGKIYDTQIFDNTNNFNANGLFSTTIFGAVGSEFRNRIFGYIDLNIEIIHPIVYDALIKVKAMYKQIAEGKVTAIFDTKLKDFVKSTSEEASTGYKFFIEQIPNLKLEKNQSDKRSFYIELIDKAVKEDRYKLRYLLVIPAGLRDYHIDQNGKPSEDEINTYYRKIVSQSNLIDPIGAKKVPEVYDRLRSSVQNLTMDLFEYIVGMLEGKHKIVLGKWLTRKIFNSTRNVASNFIEKTNNINDFNRVRYNESIVGIAQYSRALVPRSIYELKTKYIKDIFKENTTSAFLTNAATLKKEEVLNTHIQKEYDQWTTSEGLLQIIASLNNESIRDLPITLNKGKHYLGLIYRDNKYVKFFQDIDELPSEYNKDNVFPITISEFIYMSLYESNGKYPGLVTRYPITGYGSVYPCFLKMVTTLDSYELEELDYEWKPSGNIAYSFPSKDSSYFNTVGVHPSHLKSLGGDFDGDTMSVTALLSDEAIEEIKNTFNKKEYYINSSVGFNFEPNTEIVSGVLSFMTGSVK